MNASILNEIKKLESTLHALLPIKEEYQQRLDKKFRLEFNYNSNHLEGNTLTYGETELLLIFDETKGNHTFREYEEMEAHDVAFALVSQWAKDKESPLTEKDIKNLNKTILVKPYWKDAVTPDGQNTRRQIKVGDYKESPNSVILQNGEIFHYTSPGDTPIEMGNLVQWFREEEEKKTLHPVELAALVHYKFVRIHPFDDGNGRISRLLLNYFLLRNGFPPIVIKSEDKKNYLSALHLADIGDMDSFVDYVGAQLIWSLNISIKAAMGESLDEPGDLDKRLGLLKTRVGLGNDPVVKKQYDAQSIKAVLEQSILPLTIAWETKLKDFDSLIYSRSAYVYFNGDGFTGDDMVVLMREQMTQYIRPKKPLSVPLIKELSIECYPHGLRSLKREVGLAGGKIDLRFFAHTYEIEFSGGRSMLKLYDETLTKEEIDAIVESLGTLLLNSIEARIKSV